MNALHLLTVKSVKVLIRKKSNRTLIAVSSILVFCTLYLMWYLSRHQQLRFMTSDAYQRLEFNMKCTSETSVDSVRHRVPKKELKCSPDGAAVDRSSKGLTPSDLLFNKLNTGLWLADDSETSQFAALLSSLMMNGLPLLGLDDFVHFSDFVRNHVGTKITEKILSSPGYKEKFSNFLEVRSNHLLLYPDSCWTRQFVSYLKASSKVFKDLKYKIYPTQKQAMKHCCHKVWAVVEIGIQGDSSRTRGGMRTGNKGVEDGADTVCTAFAPDRWNQTTLINHPYEMPIDPINSIFTASEGTERIYSIYKTGLGCMSSCGMNHNIFPSK